MAQPMYRPQARRPQQAQMPIRFVSGKPGRFYDPRTKRIFDVSQMYEGDKYDTVAFVPGALAGLQQFFFQNIQNKLRLDCNFLTQNRLDANERMVLERLGIYIHMAVGTILPTSANVKWATENAYAVFTINGDTVLEAPVPFWPSGYGIVGQTTDTDATFATIGVAGTAAAARLRRRQMLTNEHSLGGNIQYQARAWDATYVGPTTTTVTYFKMILHGLISRPATR